MFIEFGIPCCRVWLPKQPSLQHCVLRAYNRPALIHTISTYGNKSTAQHARKNDKARFEDDLPDCEQTATFSMNVAYQIYLWLDNFGAKYTTRTRPTSRCISNKNGWPPWMCSSNIPAPCLFQNSRGSNVMETGWLLDQSGRWALSRRVHLRGSQR